MQEIKQRFSFKNIFSSLTAFRAIQIIAILGFLIYTNSLLNNFVLDDIGQIVNNPSVRSITSIPGLFLNHTIAQQISFYYRPLTMSIYTVIYSVFGQNPFFYHLVQLIFHIGNSILIFLIFKKFLKQNLALLLSLLFLVHPINEGTVVYIANLPDVLFVFFGLLSFYLLQKNYEKNNYILVNIFLSLSILSKESGVLFFIISIIYLFLFHKKKLLKQTVASFFILLFYLSLRIISNLPFQKPALTLMVELPFLQRIINVPTIIYYYLRILIFPKDLISINTWVINRIQFANFYFPFIIDCIFLIALFFICLFIYKKGKEKKLLLFFSLWLILGLVIHLQIIPIDETVADRYFYFPLVGLLGLIGLFFQEIKTYGLIKRLLIPFGIMTLLILSVRSVIRNQDWKTQSILVSHDEKLSHGDYMLEYLYGLDLITKNNDRQALPYIQESLKLYPKSSVAWCSLGVIYYRANDIWDAKKAFQESISVGSYYGSYENMALLLLSYGNPAETRDFIRKATSVYANSEKLWYYRIIMEYRAGNRDEALFAAKNYLILKQDNEAYNIYMAIQQNLPIKIN